MITTSDPISSIGRGFALSLILFCASLLCRERYVCAQIVRWEIEATVFELRDPNMIFTQVRAGDPVRGFVSWNLSTVHESDDEEPTNFADYIHPPTFQVAGMVIENPRDGTEISFTPDVCDDCAFVSILNTDFADLILASQSVVRPDGYQGAIPAIDVGLLGPPNLLADARLPTTLELDDWPDASISVGEPSSMNPNASYVAAQIHTLTPMALPNIPGDFNADGTVDAADYVAWRDGLGTTYTQADYDTWRNNFRKTAATITAAAGSAGNLRPAVPEATTMQLIALGFVTLTLRTYSIRNRWQRPDNYQLTTDTSKTGR